MVTQKEVEHGCMEKGQMERLWLAVKSQQQMEEFPSIQTLNLGQPSLLLPNGIKLGMQKLILSSKSFAMKF
jgi:hypothetical protein